MIDYNRKKNEPTKTFPPALTVNELSWREYSYGTINTYKIWNTDVNLLFYLCFRNHVLLAYQKCCIKGDISKILGIQCHFFFLFSPDFHLSLYIPQKYSFTFINAKQ